VCSDFSQSINSIVSSLPGESGNQNQPIGEPNLKETMQLNMRLAGWIINNEITESLILCSLNNRHLSQEMR
jgi:hypothetical protein